MLYNCVTTITEHKENESSTAGKESPCKSDQVKDRDELTSKATAEERNACTTAIPKDDTQRKPAVHIPVLRDDAIQVGVLMCGCVFLMCNA